MNKLIIEVAIVDQKAADLEPQIASQLSAIGVLIMNSHIERMTTLEVDETCAFLDLKREDYP